MMSGSNSRATGTTMERKADRYSASPKLDAAGGEGYGGREGWWEEGARGEGGEEEGKVRERRTRKA